MSMPLKRKFAISAVLLFSIFLANRHFKFGTHSAEVAVKLRIETKYTDLGEPLLLSQAKEITGQASMLELLHRLGRTEVSSEKNQREILEIQKHIHVERQGNTEIFILTVRHPNIRWAKEIATQLAQAFQKVESMQERAEFEARASELERQADAARDAIDIAELEFKKAQMQNSPSEVDNVLLSRLQEKQTKLKILSETYTSIHPDIIGLNNEIDSLKAQLNDGPPININAVKEAEQHLRDADAHYRNLRQQSEDARLKIEEVVGHVKILEITSKTAGHSPRLNPIYLAAFVAIIILLLILRFVSR